MISKKELDKLEQQRLIAKTILNSDYSKCIIDGKDHFINDIGCCTKCGIKLYQNVIFSTPNPPLIPYNGKSFEYILTMKGDGMCRMARSITEMSKKNLKRFKYNLKYCDTEGVLK